MDRKLIGKFSVTTYSNILVFKNLKKHKNHKVKQTSCSHVYQSIFNIYNQRALGLITPVLLLKKFLTILFFFLISLSNITFYKTKIIINFDQNKALCKNSIFEFLQLNIRKLNNIK